MVVQTILF